MANPREFVPVAVDCFAIPRPGARGIEVELRSVAVTMKLTWPLSASVDFADWTRELLR